MVEQSPITSKGNFIEANTKAISLDHLKSDCIIPVFAKDNETTISHYSFVKTTYEIAKSFYPEHNVLAPDIRVSHVIKGRIPSAIGKPAKELKEHEKTLYYERCAFSIEVKGITAEVGGNTLNLSIGGVRAYNQENLYSKKSLERFKLFIGFSNAVCTNLCVSTDGLLDEVRVADVTGLSEKITGLLNQYDPESHLDEMQRLTEVNIDESMFAHIVGKMKMYHQLSKSDRKALIPVLLNDGQIRNLVKGYYHDVDFSANNGRINLWQFYNLLTGANKSSYIDSYLERGANAHAIVHELARSIQNRTPNWLLPAI